MVKFAMTALAVDMVTVQLAPLPLQPPLQPAKVQPDDAVADRVTLVPPANIAVQAPTPVPQLMPAGVLTTAPDPDRYTDNLACDCVTLNVAVTLRAAVIDTEQVLADPAHEPPQPAKLEPADATADSVTVAPVA